MSPYYTRLLEETVAIIYHHVLFVFPQPQEDRQSDPNLEEKLQQAAKELNEEKRRSARRKEYVE